jgi:nitrilase
MLKVAVTQLSAPDWLNRDGCLAAIVDAIQKAATNQADLICFSECFVPGYPLWLEETGGAKFNDPKQKELFAYYSDQAVTIERGHLASVCQALKDARMAAYLGILERPVDRSGHTLYCTLVYIDKTGTIQSVHRKLQPTYEERLVWGQGDGHGLVTHSLGEFTVGGLNCWENWMPLSRTALYAQGEDVHVAVWPGSIRHTKDLTPMIAREGRSFAISIGCVITTISKDIPYADEIQTAIGGMAQDGGSCVAGPDGTWILPPGSDEEIRYCELDPAFVRRERQNFDPTGHYSRPDVTRLIVNRKRQSLAEFED